MAAAQADFVSLHGLLAEAFASATEPAVRRLEALLVRLRPKILRLLEYGSKSNEHRELVKKNLVPIAGQEHRVSDEFVRLTLQLSDELDIDELLAVELLHAGVLQRASFGRSAYETALLLYFSERRHLLQSLYDLLLGPQTDVQQDGLKYRLGRYTSELIRSVDDGKSFPVRMLHTLTQLAAKIKQARERPSLSGVDIASFYSGERKLLAQCFFHVSYEYQLKSNEVIDLLTMLMKSDGNEDYHVTIILLLSMMASIDTATERHSHGATHEITLGANMDFIKSFSDALPKEWVDKGVRAVVTLSWALFLATNDGRSVNLRPNELDPFFFSAIDQNALLFMSDKMLGYGSVAKEDVDVQFFEYIRLQLDFFITEIIKTRRMQSYLKQLKQRDENALVQSSTDASSIIPSVVRHDFENLLLLIARIYDKNPDAALKFWKDPIRDPEGRLHQFIAIAGDANTPGCLVAFFRMLTAMAYGEFAAKSVYDFMNLRHPHVHRIISWDELFKEMDHYYVILRGSPNPQENPSRMFVQGQPQPNAPLEMQPAEVEVMEAALGLLHRVVVECEPVRLLLYQHPGWRVIPTLFGLLACRVPASLKAALLKAIAGFALSPDMANDIWRTLEASQILPTVPASHLPNAPQVEGGIKFELEEVESRNETYPETIAFTTLIETLLKTGSYPHSLGYGYRDAGIQPYVQFIVDNILLKARIRAYKDSREKWSVLSLCVRVIQQLVKMYEVPSVATTNVPAAKPALPAITYPQLSFNQPAVTPALSEVDQLQLPGFKLMAAILVGSKLTEALFWILEQGSDNNGRDALDRQSAEIPAFGTSVLATLNVLSIVLEKQDAFIAFAKTTNLNIMPDKLEILLMRQQSVLIQISTYINTRSLGSVSLAALGLFRALANRDEFKRPTSTNIGKTAPGGLVGVLESSADKYTILQGLQERLEDDADDEETSNEFGLVRRGIADMLLDCLNNPTPNLTQFILGYDVTRVSQTVIADPEMYDARLTCFHVILDLLMQNITSPDGPTLPQKHPYLAERCYRLMVRLCEDKNTSTPTMNYLRKKEFFVKNFAHLFEIDEIPENIRDQRYGRYIAQMHARAWLLRAIALELHVTTLNGLTGQTELLLRIGFSKPSPMDSDGDESQFEESSFAMQRQPEQPRIRMLELLNGITFRRPTYADVIDVPSYAGVKLDNFLMVDEHGSTIYDVTAIHQNLINTVIKEASKKGVASLNRALEDAQNFLELVVVQNQARRAFHAHCTLFEAWKQIAVVTLSECFEFLNTEGQESVPTELIQELLPKITASDTHVTLVEAMTAVVLSLFTRLRQKRRQQDVLSNHEDGDDDGLLLPMDSLHDILATVVASILTSGATQTLRGHLYTILLNYLQFTAPPTQLSDSSSSSSTLESERESVFQNQLDRGSLSIIHKDADKVLEMICRDASDASDIWKTVAYTTLDALLVLASRAHSNSVLSFLLRSSYFDYFVQSINDPELTKVLESNPSSLNKLYIYEAKLALLLRLAQSRVGAERLIDRGLLSVLSDCRFLDLRPDDFGTPMEPNEEVSTPLERYHQLLRPVLQLTLCILSLVGRGNSNAAIKVSAFLRAHNDLVTSHLRDRLSTITLMSLEELQYLTNIFYNIAGREPNDGSTGYRRLLLQLLTKYSQPKRWNSRLKAITNTELQDDQELLQATGWGPKGAQTSFRRQAHRLALDICRNIVSYARVINDQSGFSNSFVSLFTPSLASSDDRDVDAADSRALMSDFPPLSMLVSFLSTTITALNDAVQTIELGIHYKLTHIKELSQDEINELSEPASSLFFVRLAPAQRQQLAVQALKQAMTEEAKRVANLIYSLENILYVLWRHLNYYVTQYTPNLSTGNPGVDIAQLVSNARTTVLEPLGKLSNIKLTRSIIGATLDEHVHFIDLLSRLLRDVIAQRQR